MRNIDNIVITLAAVALAATVGCAGSAKLDGAKVDIPVFAPSNLDGDPKGGWAAVDAFYHEKLPSAQRDDETSPVAADESPLENEIRYTWIPAGWTGGARVMVLIDKETHDGKTRFRLIQDVLKH